MSIPANTVAGPSGHMAMPGESTAATSATSQIASEVGLVSNELMYQTCIDNRVGIMKQNPQRQ